MKKIIVLLCLGLIGCATVAQESKTPVSPITKTPTVVDQIEIDSVISVFTQAIKNDPNYAGAYYNRAVAYFYKKDFEQCWQDVHKAESLGYSFSPDFLEELKQASHREK